VPNPAIRAFEAGENPWRSAGRPTIACKVGTSTSRHSFHERVSRVLRSKFSGRKRYEDGAPRSGINRWPPHAIAVGRGRATLSP
jgi:hypothetical protein